MALEQEIKVYQFQLAYGEILLKDIDPGKVFALICDGGASPAWLVGHLALVANDVVAMCGGQPQIDVETWKPLFGGGSQPRAGPSAYPAWEELLAAWKAGHAAVAAVVPGVPAEQLITENPVEFLREGLPTLHDFLSFVLTGHEAMHMGQLSTWRRVQGQPPLF